MYLTESFFVIMAWVATSALGDYQWIESQGRVQLYRVAIPVVRPSSFVRPNKFRNPTTTKRPFRLRPSTGRPQSAPFVVPPMTTSRPMIVVGPPPPLPPEPVPPAIETNLVAPAINGPYDGGPSLSSPGTFQASSPESSGGIVSTIPQSPLVSGAVERPPTGALVSSQSPPSEPSGFPSQPSFIPIPAAVAAPQPATPKPVLTYPPQSPLVFPVVRPPALSMSRPIPKPSRPPRPPQINVEPPKNPSAQPPFDSGPYFPPKPPPAPVTSTSNFGVNPPNGKPQRPLPPSRPILIRPPPLPQPSFQLTTTEKPSLIYNESTMSDDGNYTFDFLVSNSVYRREQGFLKKSLTKPWNLILVKTGAYSFTSPEGTLHRTDFVADENGYRAFQSTS